MSSVTLTGIHSDVWSCLLPFCSFTDLLRLSHIHPHIHSLSRQRSWSDCIRRCHLHPHLTATQQSLVADKGWSTEQLVEFLLAALARVETHLLHNHLIPPLHLTLLLQALLTADLSTLPCSFSSSSSSASHRTTASLSHHHSLAHTSTYPNLQNYFLHYHRHPSDGPLPSPTSLHSLSLPSVCLWLSNPFAVPSWVHRFSMRKRTAEAQDEVRDVVAQVDSRVVWIGSAQLRTNQTEATAAAAASPYAIGYWLGDIQRPRDRHTSVVHSSTTIAQCRQRITDVTVEWSTLPIVVYRIHASTMEHLTHAHYASVRIFDSLTDVLRLALPTPPQQPLMASSAVSVDELAARVDEVLGVGSSSGVVSNGQTLLILPENNNATADDGRYDEWQQVMSAAASTTAANDMYRPRRKWVA